MLNRPPLMIQIEDDIVDDKPLSQSLNQELGQAQGSVSACPSQQRTQYIKTLIEEQQEAHDEDMAELFEEKEYWKERIATIIKLIQEKRTSSERTEKIIQTVMGFKQEQKQNSNTDQQNRPISINSSKQHTNK